ncbi:MAG: calcium-binding protein [Devosia sp.]
MWIFDVAGNVPADQEALIREGLDIAADYAARLLGGAIPNSLVDISTIKIVATGVGEFNAPANAGMTDGKLRLFFDVAHEQWNQDSSGRGWTTESDSMKTVVHEYTHGWQMWLGAFSNSEQQLGGALIEGIAEYVAYAAMVDAGRMSWANIRPFMLNGAYQSHELDDEVQEVEKTVWSGHVGFLVVDWLVGDAPSGILSLRTLALEIEAGRSVAEAFRTAFNIELADFYVQFEAWRQIILDDVDAGYANRPTLINIGENTAGATPGPDTIVGTPSKDELAGLAGDDHISGRGGNDKLYGNEDNDTLVGGAGKDALDGGLGRDTASYESALAKLIASLKTPAGNTGDARGDTYFLIENLAGSAYADLLTGNDSANLITGGNGKDTIAGGKGGDTLAGGKGQDLLDGGTGKDFFLFDVKPGAGNADTISGFKPNDDTIRLDDAVFSPLAAGALPRAAFFSNQTGKAHDRSDRIVYEEDTGKLFYDADGSRSAIDRVLIATLDAGLSLKAADFEIV